MPRYNNQQVLHAFNTLDSVFIEKVYNEMTPQIEHYLLKNGGRKENAADLIQEVFESISKIFTNNDFEFKNNASYSTFILSVAQKKWLNFLRKKKTEQDNTDQYTQIGLPDKEQIEETIFEAEIKKLIDFSIAKLNKACKEILFMRYQKNMSHKEIMTELMLNTEATSRERLRYCQQNLRNNITKNADYLQLIAEYYPFILKSIKQK
ncbi:MAG: sigma-70 family RNA polymerase sigma factor [Sphingobacteriales bacterium]|nr:sigma-70 family RNA polymerase sigma factor [Sphingobacteriales bacterium]